MTTATLQQKRIKVVCDFIDEHLDETLTLELLSEVAVCSKYHFHRIFKSFTGISIMQYVLLSRMKRASFRLAFEPQVSVTNIAFEASFESLEAFSRAFSRLFKQTPTQFRKQPEWKVWHKQFEFKSPMIGEHPMNVRIIDFAKRDIAFIKHRGSLKLVYESLAKFIAWRKSSGLSPIKSSETFGIPYSDPNDTPEEEFRFDIAGSYQGEVPENTYGVQSGAIPSGRCAVVIHKGSRFSIGESIHYLYQTWLPESGETLREYPCFFKYLNFVHEVDECDLLTEVYLPIQ
ncbi:AraC family transcriptional regulator [Vibrio campbellii]|jgi:AraC family transcriptional regulator|uniref:AraC family transcriptional regulator n=1 Tax=Vibrio campbellii TaxID=680 RepID=UPI0002AE6282|nr:GyrI-like domain-containing protein [Vibrio campbellii]ARV75374.1 AraC family transcriptional regulator [Vibrio campbellii CAIM 519 = NBRC 15631 = ATCC 25920]ELU50751.1 transcriptional regulator [Vibrio campbellii CAIM 519 = NBRC 15631 = ATCC 25920]RDX38093.1 helix-turn-helix domain-containing protein [Vibrio campbellii]